MHATSRKFAALADALHRALENAIAATAANPDQVRADLAAGEFEKAMGQSPKQPGAAITAKSRRGDAGRCAGQRGAAAVPSCCPGQCCPDQESPRFKAKLTLVGGIQDLVSATILFGAGYFESSRTTLSGPRTICSWRFSGASARISDWLGVRRAVHSGSGEASPYLTAPELLWAPRISFFNSEVI